MKGLYNKRRIKIGNRSFKRGSSRACCHGNYSQMVKKNVDMWLTHIKLVKSG